jgi:hypothetical protein
MAVRASDSPSPELISALSSATAASFMYGYAVVAALNGRFNQIEEKAWIQRSPRCYVPIAMYGGLASWAIIVASTVIWKPGETVSSLVGLWELAESHDVQAGVSWTFLPTKIVTALPWFVAGATASILLAYFLAGDVRRTKIPDRWHDALALGGGLGLAAGVSEMIQMTFDDFITSNTLTYGELIGQSCLIAFAGVACGMVLGFFVPQAYKANIVTPLYADVAHMLKRLVKNAASAFGNEQAGENWAFTPAPELGGITPAEAIQHRALTHAAFSLIPAVAAEAVGVHKLTTLLPLDGGS